MQKWLVRLIVGAVATSGLIACGGASSPAASHTFPAESLFELTSESGQQQIAVRTAPDQPPARGVVAVQLTITDLSTGAAQSGLGLRVVPWMPVMGHGTSVKPIVVESAPGIYDLENLVLFMPGTWQVRTEWDESPVAHVNPTFDIR